MGINRRDENTIYKPFDGVTQTVLTGKETGPELKFLLPLLSRELILNRLGIKK